MCGTDYSMYCVNIFPEHIRRNFVSWKEECPIRKSIVISSEKFLKSKNYIDFNLSF